ncbi:hypothetical protein GC194_03130, partial [bacterium]|nr:hypothetical protein [bacterium]
MTIPELWFSKEDEVFKDYKVVDNGSDANHLTGLSRINIFIGPNNSGKSRFLRNLFDKFYEVQNNPNGDLKDHPIHFRLFNSSSIKSKLKEFEESLENIIQELDDNEKSIALKIKDRL